MTASSATPPRHGIAGPATLTNRSYLLTVLLVILAFNFVDRLAMGIVLEDIKADLALSDTQLGMLTGIAFAIFYAAMGVPIARWADRGNRVVIIALCCGIWSIAVILSGLAASFVQLLLIRMVVAIGEAGCEPAALSLISDYFRRDERARAVSRYKLGWPIALIIGNLAAGWLSQLYGWRATFILLGLPSLAIALVAWLTVRDPRTMGTASAARVTVERPPLGEVMAALWRNRSYRHLLLCFLFSSFFTYGILQWQPAYFMRSHGLAAGELGTWLAVVYGGGTLLGTYFGGELIARYAAANERLQLLVTGALYAIFAVLTAGVYLATDHRLAFAFLGLAVLGGGATNGPLFAATQSLVPPSMRAMSVAIVLFVSNLIGAGFGPLLAGGISDLLQPQFGADSLRYALVAMSPGYLWCTWHLWKCSKTVESDAAAAQAAEDRLHGAVPTAEPNPRPRRTTGDIDAV